MELRYKVFAGRIDGDFCGRPGSCYLPLGETEWGSPHPSRRRKTCAFIDLQGAGFVTLDYPVMSGGSVEGAVITVISDTYARADRIGRDVANDLRIFVEDVSDSGRSLAFGNRAYDMMVKAKIASSDASNN